MNKFTITRFLRTLTDIGVLYEPEQEREVAVFTISNLGGITFHFDIDFARPNPVHYSYTMCRASENFDRKAGKETAEAKFTAGNFIVMDNYDQDASLIINVWNDLSAKGANKDPIFLDKKLYRLKTAMRKIFNDQDMVTDTAEHLDSVWSI